MEINQTASEVEANMVRALAALAQAQRLRTFKTLVTAGPPGVTPGAIAQAIGTSGSALSFHLKELVYAGLATCEPRGRNLIYRANFGQMARLMGYLTAHCCQGADCGLPACALAEAVCP